MTTNVMQNQWEIALIETQPPTLRDQCVTLRARYTINIDCGVSCSLLSGIDSRLRNPIPNTLYFQMRAYWVFESVAAGPVTFHC